MLIGRFGKTWVAGAAKPILVALLLVLAACTPLPRQGWVGSQWLPSPNYDARRPNFVILHHTSNAAAEHGLRTLRDPLREVSAHYLVGRDGHIWQLVDESARAWHAGDSRWGNLTDLNSASIGIELDNSGDEPYAEPQIQALLVLLADVTARQRIPRRHVLGHGDVAPWRKVDPGILFPWERLAGEGFGLWCGASFEPVPAAFDSALALRAIGYDLRNPGVARAAFRRHFLKSDSEAEFDQAELALLHCLMQRQAEADEQ